MIPSAGLRCSVRKYAAERLALFILTGNLGGEFAACEAERNLIADCDLVGGPQNFSGGVVSDGVAAFEDFEGAALFELHHRGLDPTAFRNEHAIKPDLQVVSVALPSATKACDARKLPR